MFIRRRGRKFYLLHSYRDGSGRVCQRRLGDFHDAAGLDRQLGLLPQRCPEIQVDLPRLRRQAETMLDDHSPEPNRTPAQRVEKIRRATRALLTLLAEEEDAEVLHQAAPDLSILQSRLNKPRSEGEDEESCGRWSRTFAVAYRHGAGALTRVTRRPGPTCARSSVYLSSSAVKVSWQRAPP